MSMAASALKGSDVELLAIVMEDSIGGNHEVYVSGVSVPNVIHAGDHYNVTVSVTSNENSLRLFLFFGHGYPCHCQDHRTNHKNTDCQKLFLLCRVYLPDIYDPLCCQ